MSAPTDFIVHSAPHRSSIFGNPGWLVYTISQGSVVGYDESDQSADGSPGGPTPGSPFTAGAMPSALAATTSLLFVSNSQSNDLSVFQITSNHGAIALVGQFPAGTAPTDLSLDSSGKFLFVANKGSNSVSAFSVDPATKVLVPVSGTFLTGTAPTHITTTP